MLYQEEFEQAFKSPNPVETLRSLALQLHAQGRNKQEIYDIFYEFYQFLQAAERQTEEDLLGDVMDMITGTFAPHNITFPDLNS
jgi:predicted metalloprotease with PDZ domain